jgi:hypothetical protein
MNFIKHSFILLNNKKRILYKNALSKSVNPTLYIKQDNTFIKYKLFLKIKKSKKKYMGGITPYYDISNYSIQEFIELYNQNESMRQYRVKFTDVGNVAHLYNIIEVFDVCHHYVNALNYLKQVDESYYNSIVSSFQLTLIGLANKHTVICNDFNEQVIKIEIIG